MAPSNLSKSQSPRTVVAFFALYSLLACAACGDSAPLELGDVFGADSGGADATIRDGSPEGWDGPGDGGPFDATQVPDGTVYVDPSVNRAPTLSNFRIDTEHPDRVRFDSSEPLRGSTGAGFVVSGRTISSVHIGDGMTGHSFVTNAGFDYFDNNTVRYEGGSDIQDVDGNPLHPFSLQYVVNYLEEPESPVERFVTAIASGGGNGLSEASAWTLWEAASQAEAGQTVWVKAGRYTGQEMYVAQSGTVERPIKFVGYKDAPGDITSMYYAYPGVPDVNEMPTIDEGYPTAGRNTHIRGSFLIFRNFQSTNINGRAFYSTNAPEGVIFDNCVAHNAWTPSGVGFQFNSRSGQRNRVINSVAVNNSMSGIFVAGDFNLVDNCKVYSDGTDSAYGDMREGGDEANDYYAGFDGSHNIMRNVYAERVNDGGHSGHGLTLKSDDRVNEIFYNLVEDSTVVGSGTGFELRHDDVQFNVIRNLTFLPGRIPLSSPSAAGGLMIRDGAHHNRIENCQFRGVRYGISFRDNTEEGAQPSGEHNVIANCVFENLLTNIMAYRQNGLDGRVSYTTFVNNTFVGAGAMYSDPRRLMGGGTNRIINSIIVGVGERYEHADSGFEELHNAYWMSYAVPEGEGNISAAPGFMDAESGDYRLGSSSSLIDMGTAMPEVVYDIQGVERPQGESYDLGAFEFYDSER